jgi:hypothetical protein
LPLRRAKAATAMGIKIPRGMPLRADEVIEWAERWCNTIAATVSGGTMGEFAAAHQVFSYRRISWRHADIGNPSQLTRSRRAATRSLLHHQ